MKTNPTKILYDYQDQKLSALDLAKTLDLNLSDEQTRTMANRLRYHALKRGIDRAMEIMAKAKPPKSNKTRLTKPSTKPVIKIKNRAYSEWLRVNSKDGATKLALM